LLVLILLLLLHLDNIHNSLEGEGLIRRQLGKYFPIERNVRFLHGRHELAVPDSVLSNAGIETGDPQFAPISLLDLAIPIGVLPGLLETTDGNREATLGTAAESLDLAEDGLVLKVWIV
jgi:hypothetical protein